MSESQANFNQGLDARQFTSWHAGQIARLKSPMVRFAFDHPATEGKVADAIATARAAGLRDFGVYVLIGFSDTPEDALYRLTKVREWGIMPNPMRFQPLEAKEKNAFVHPAWTEYELRKMVKYHSRLVWYGHIPYADWHYADDDCPLFAASPATNDNQAR